MPPLVPVMVIVRVPVLALAPTVMVMVDAPAPVIEVGLKVAVSFLPRPEALKLMGALKPPVTEVVIVEVPLLPRAMVSDAGDALSEKPADTPVTVRVTVVVSVVLPEVPVTVIGYVPVAVVEATVMLMVELPVPVIDVGLKPIVTPEGCPLAVKVTGELNPPVTVLVIVEFPAPPCVIDTLAGEAERLKPCVELAPVSAAISPAFGLPQPVTRSYPVTAE